MGPFWCSCQHRCIRLNPYSVRMSSTFPTFYFQLCIFSSLSASKEAGASIEIEGRKIALGIPDAQRPVNITTTQASEDYPLIPLRRGGTPEDAASSVLLYVSYVIKKNATDFQYISTAWPRLLLHMSPGILWKLQVALVSKKKRTYQSYVCATLPMLLCLYLSYLLDPNTLAVVMSTQTNYPAGTLQHRPYPHLQSNDSKEFDASYDTLIDVNGPPYTSNSRHQTFTIATPTTSCLQQGLSIPLSKLSSKQSDDTHETSGSQPPVVTHPSEVDVPSLWQRVSGISPFCPVYVSHLPY